MHPSLIEAAQDDGAGELGSYGRQCTAMPEGSSRNTVPHRFYYNYNSCMWLTWLSPLGILTDLRPGFVTTLLRRVTS
ncbi:hypothetical protein O9993_17290 [Vibrio lentus]|nr:hypothetical protein [Vibrio lentus]